MKRQVQTKTKEELLKKYPIDDFIQDWYFDMREISPSCYRFRGIDKYGNKVERSGIDQKQLFDQIEEDVNRIISHSKHYKS